MTNTEQQSFEREERYIVFKKSHLTEDQLRKLERLTTRPQIPPSNSHDDPTLPTVECVVVEHDWPEYEPVWRMIEDRVTGKAALERTHNPGRAWLIEEDAGGITHWIALAKGQWPRTTRSTHPYVSDRYQTPVQRVKDANEALRFARQEDAEAFIELFDRFLLGAVATEHEWPAAEALSTIQPPAIEDERGKTGIFCDLPYEHQEKIIESVRYGPAGNLGQIDATLAAERAFNALADLGCLRHFAPSPLNGDVVEALKYAIEFIETLPEDCMGECADVIDFQTGEQGEPYPIRDEWLHNARAALAAFPSEEGAGDE